MLGDHPIAPVLLATDLAAAREFYHGKLGLLIEKEDQNAIVFRCGGGTHLDVTKSSTGNRRAADPGSVAGQRHPRRGSGTPHSRHQGRRLRHPGTENRRRNRRHRLRLGRLDHRPGHERPRHPPDQGGVAE